MASGRDKHSETKRFISNYCRNLKVDEVDWEAASDPLRYNCMGFAVGVLKWWQPHERDRGGRIKNPFDYWPPGVPDKYTVECYIKAAETVNFVECEPGWEPAFEKIVLLFKDIGGERLFKHAARQCSPDRWQSKLGQLSDIEHGEEMGLGCVAYGDGRIYMKRPRLPSGDPNNPSS